jgi:hypothetical protein
VFACLAFAALTSQQKQSDYRERDAEKDLLYAVKEEQRQLHTRTTLSRNKSLVHEMDHSREN